MLTFHILLSFIVFEFTAGDSGILLFHPMANCVPTATIRGPRHTCVCYVDGVYHCQALSPEKPDNESEPTTPATTPACEPDQQYREGSTLCSCTKSGQWRSSNCRELFHRLVLRRATIRNNIQTDITCKPGSLYITDCNVCSCQNTSIINFSSCTTRPCPKRLKTDSCVHGEVYRTKDEFCFCSSANFYIDTFCIKVGDGVMEEIEEKILAGVFDDTNLYPKITIDQCDSNVTLYFDCNTCSCYQNTYLCTSRYCYDDEPVLRLGKDVYEKLPELKSQKNICIPGSKYKYKSNVTKGASARRSLPKIKYGEPCEPGQTYRMDCNRCFCTSAAKLLCTQIACVDWFKKQPYKINKKLQIAARQGKTKTLRNKKVAAEGKTNKTDEGNANKSLLTREGISNRKLKYKKLTVREGHSNETLKVNVTARGRSNKRQQKKRTKTRQGKSKMTGELNAKNKNKPLQELPAGDCIPGRVYKSGCQRCFCDDTRKAQCALKAEACADENGVINPIDSPEDVRPPFDREELTKAKTLSSASDKCDPGFKYKVSCNLCVCSERGNLLCSKELCLSFEDMNRVEAAEKSGEKCTQDPTQTGCIECKCVKGKLSCVDIPNCVGDTRLKLSGGGNNDIKMKLNPMKEKCIPQGIYRDNCNRCYCQKDRTLRCTQKTCLVYSQALKLHDQLKQMKS